MMGTPRENRFRLESANQRRSRDSGREWPLSQWSDINRVENFFSNVFIQEIQSGTKIRIKRIQRSALIGTLISYFNILNFRF